MIERFRSSGGVFWAAAKPFDPTGSTRVPSQAGAAVALPIRVTAGLGSDAAGDAGVAAGALGVVAGTGAGDGPEQPAATPQASRAVNSRRSRTGSVCLVVSSPGHRPYGVPMIKAGARRFGALGGVLALSVASLAGGPYESEPPAGPALDMCSAPNVTCVFSFGPPRSPSHPQIVSGPPPTRLATNGVPGCVRGSRRPVVHTTTPTLEATYAAPVPASFELAPLDGSEQPDIGSTQAAAGEPVVWEIGENGLAPGRTYQWRTTGVPLDPVKAPVWSQWCEFTVAADLVDLRPATDVPTVRELRVDPARRYPVTLRAGEWRIAVDGLVPEDEGVVVDDPFRTGDNPAQERDRQIKADIQARIAGRAAGRPATVVLTGDEWATVAANLAAGAQAWAEEYGEDPGVPDEAPRHWKVLDRISAQLGGPAHPLRAR